MAPDTFRQAYLKDIAGAFRNYKLLGERAMAQVSDENLHAMVDPDANSIAILVKHVGGNLRSRFTDFLTSDGEKPTRNRDDEFEMPVQASRTEVLEWWESGWAATLGAIDALTADDLDRTIQIRGEAFLVVEALSRSITHTAYHVGQIVMLAKHLAGPHWATLSIPKGKSNAVITGRYKDSILPPQSR
jgi:hypothetical protein